MKAKDCVECGPKLKMWSSYKKDGQSKKVRRTAIRQIHLAKRDHGNVKYHLWVWDFHNNNWVKGCANKALIHNGGK